ncbi:hypothetical protein BO78DRAFT_158610 [Aspergillus sclerotiicarbonarius CBS 121057]|uniref:Uncharacterized protein n=1 Tax=Aspergillus sclerotiicarbonarius (strain CBS 121057 / IBT 28362) TaxID=1448318 RepID=A0A319E4A8_ASPSB|nr:hypothetical protein BO78DRAFT_158610 [Aspergillus sclerotiicarbonarius CBS 121057]
MAAWAAEEIGAPSHSLDESLSVLLFSSASSSSSSSTLSLPVVINIMSIRAHPTQQSQTPSALPPAIQKKRKGRCGVYPDPLPKQHYIQEITDPKPNASNRPDIYRRRTRQRPARMNPGVIRMQASRAKTNRNKRAEYERAANANICTNNVSVSQQMWNPEEVPCMPAKGRNKPERMKGGRRGKETPPQQLNK